MSYIGNSEKQRRVSVIVVVVEHASTPVRIRCTYTLHICVGLISFAVYDVSFSRFRIDCYSVDQYQSQINRNMK
jgi:hypothetical protein